MSLLNPKHLRWMVFLRQFLKLSFGILKKAQERGTNKPQSRKNNEKLINGGL